MTRRLAASVALIAFAVCLVAGARAGNTFPTTVGRALLAMVGTLIIGLIVGTMAQVMVNESVASNAAATEPSEKSSSDSPPPGR